MTVTTRRMPHVVITTLVVLLMLLLITSVARNDRFQWDIIAKYLTYSTILRGIGMTLWITVMTVVLGLLGGIAIVALRSSRFRALSGAAWAFTWFFRSVPMLVQLLFWYNLAALYPHLSIGIPGGPTWWQVDTNSVIGPITAVVVGFTLHESAYMAEILRSGLAAIPRGQWQAGRSIGMTETQLYRRVVLPQVVRVVLPTIGNETINIVKETSLISVLAITDLLYAVQLIYGKNFQTIPLLIVATIWYLIITAVLGFGQSLLERRLGRSVATSRSNAEGRNV